METEISHCISISINPELESLVPSLSKGEFDLLTRSIQENGLREPIIVNDHGTILDGHHRFRACQILGLECSFTKKSFDDPLEEKLYVIDANRLRRQLNDVQKVELALKKKSILQEITKMNMSGGGKGVQIKVPIGRINRKLANDSGISASHFSKIEYVLNNASEEVKEKLRNGKIKPHKAYGRLRNDHFLKMQISDNKNQDELFLKATQSQNYNSKNYFIRR